MDDLAYWVAMSRVPGIGYGRLRQLKAHFGSLERAWGASCNQLTTSGLDERVATDFCEARKTLSPQSELAGLQRHGVCALTVYDPGYPLLLAETHDCPPVLYVRGQLPHSDSLLLAVVGTRRPTAYGRQVTAELVEGFVSAGVVTVSGLARGIDTLVHRETLECGGTTIAVLAGGLDLVYPAENLTLAQRILERGALISEHPPRTRLRREHFLRRNRIMSGMSRGTVVIEAGERSGALSTARNALDQNREVFSVPGSIYSPASGGTNRLIQQGEGKLIMSSSDVLTEFGIDPSLEKAERLHTWQADSVQVRLLAQMGSSPVHSDELARLLALPSQDVAAALTLMELHGIVRNLGSMHYVVTGRCRPEVS